MSYDTQGFERKRKAGEFPVPMTPGTHWFKRGLMIAFKDSSQKSRQVTGVVCAFCHGEGVDPFCPPSVPSVCYACDGSGHQSVSAPYETCDSCHGLGLWKTHPCLACHGAGVVTVDCEHRAAALDPMPKISGQETILDPVVPRHHLQPKRRRSAGAGRRPRTPLTED